MNLVLQMKKTLHGASFPEPAKGFSLRTFADPVDLPAWLALRQAAFSKEKLGVRAWEEPDFQQEFTSKAWWNPKYCWIVEDLSLVQRQLSGVNLAENGRFLGSVTLAMRSHETSVRPVVHWMMVHPRYRSAGIGRWLLATLESQAWELGFREIFLETHSSWESAVRFYIAAGYAPA
jgi:GNAT superfamily N-acetyltransferase